VIGAGLAGCEAAWQLLRRGHTVTLYEMKPQLFSPAHTSPHLAELVCSNSLRSNSIENAVGLLKEEMRQLGSLVIEAADATSVPAGGALAVDRELFSKYIEDRLMSFQTLILVREEATSLPDDTITIVASGPLTSETLTGVLADMTGTEYLYFYDAISPIVDGESIDYRKVFKASRYEEGEGDYLNCPMSREEYERFWHEVMQGEEVKLRDFEDKKCFEGCLPIEVLARRGIKTLLFGSMKPVGLIDPNTGVRPYAVVQLRRENKASTLFNIVGFQTKLTWPEQRRIFRMIPGLENAEFQRYGSIHRNTFINSPALLSKTLQIRKRDNIFLAGQISGVEGYVESAAMGLLAGVYVSRHAAGHTPVVPPAETALGALVNHITNTEYKTFQPMNVNFGLFPPLGIKIPKKKRGLAYAERSMRAIENWLKISE